MDLIFKQTELRFLDDVTPEALKKEREDDEKRRRKKLHDEQTQMQQLAGSIKINLPDGQEMQIELATEAGEEAVGTAGEEDGADEPKSADQKADRQSKPRVQIADEIITHENEQSDVGDVNKPLISVAQLKRSQPGDQPRIDFLNVEGGETKEPIEYVQYKTLLCSMTDIHDHRKFRN